MSLDEQMVDDLIKEGRRMLLIQIQQQESVERRAAELLRLSVATLGGIVVVSGLLVASSISLGVPALIGLSFGVGCVTVSSFILAQLLVGRRGEPAISYGPHFREVLRTIHEMGANRVMFRESMVEALPDWLEDNLVRLGNQRRTKANALAWLTVGVLAVLGALLYIVGGHILV
jgi:hypothetical protein